MFSNDTDLVNHVTRQAASFWTCCNVSASCSEHPSHSTDAYTTIGNRHSNELGSGHHLPRTTRTCSWSTRFDFDRLTNPSY